MFLATPNYYIPTSMCGPNWHGHIFEDACVAHSRKSINVCLVKVSDLHILHGSFSGAVDVTAQDSLAVCEGFACCPGAVYSVLYSLLVVVSRPTDFKLAFALGWGSDGGEQTCCCAPVHSHCCCLAMSCALLRV